MLSEEELVSVEQTPVAAPGPPSVPIPAELSCSKMRIKLELEEKTRAINMLQAALVRRGRHQLKVLISGAGG